MSCSIILNYNEKLLLKPVFSSLCLRGTQVHEEMRKEQGDGGAVGGGAGGCDWLCQRQKQTWRGRTEQNKAVKDVSAQHSRWKLFYRGVNWVGREEVFDKKENSFLKFLRKGKGM